MFWGQQLQWQVCFTRFHHVDCWGSVEKVRLRMETENQKIRVGALKQSSVCLLIFRINQKVKYGRKEEKIPFPYIYNMCMVLFLLMLI